MISTAMCSTFYLILLEKISRKIFFRKALFQAKKIHIPICELSLQMDTVGKAKTHI